MRAVLAGGRLVSLGIDPRLMREPHEVVAGRVAEAVDAAFGEERPHDDSVPLIEPLALARELRAVRADLDARMARLTASVEVSAAGLRAAPGAPGGPRVEPGTPGGVPTLDFGELFDQLVEMLETIGGVPDEDLRGTSAGLVSAVCAPGPRLVALSVTARATHGGARALGGRVASAVNAALDDLEARTRLRRARSGAGAEQVMARVAELREQGLLRMRAYAQGMAALMTGIGPRG